MSTASSGPGPIARPRAAAPTACRPREPVSATPAEPRSPRSRAVERWPYLLVPFIPIGIRLELAGASAALIFATAALGIVPTAALMGRATVELAARAGPGIGSLLNATFGNAPELIIAFFALNAGLHEVVKASLVGSILGNLLLVMGASALAGGFGRPNQRFDATAAGVQALTLLLAVVALIMPAVLVLVGGDGLPLPSEQAVNFPGDVESLSIGVAIVLLVGYAGALVFSLRTHRDLFNPVYGEDDHLGTPWSVRRSVAMLAVAGAVAAVMSEILVESLTEASDSIGLSRFFLGIIVVAAISNAAEHWVAVSFARRDKLDIALNISIGSSAQIALFVAPLLVLASFVIGPQPMALVFNGFELGAVIIAILIAQIVTHEGESNWFEGVQLLAVYAVIALAFFFA